MFMGNSGQLPSLKTGGIVKQMVVFTGFIVVLSYSHIYKLVMFSIFDQHTY